MTNSYQEEQEREYIQFCADILITGIEGGINYWVDRVDDYRWDCPGHEVQAYIVWQHNPDYKDSYVERTFVNWETIHNGLKKIFAELDYDKFVNAYGWQKYWLENIATLNAGAFDVDDADEIIQIAVLNRRVYA